MATLDPVRVFQDFATVDLLSGGRAEIIAGRGAFTESFPLFGHDMADYDALFAEKLELLLAAAFSGVEAAFARTSAAFSRMGDAVARFAVAVPAIDAPTLGGLLSPAHQDAPDTTGRTSFDAPQR